MAPGQFTRTEMLAKLAPYKCKLVANFGVVELWVTGWGEPFTLSADNDHYDEFQYRRFLFLVSKTIPPGWNAGP